MDIYFKYLSLLSGAFGSISAITGWALAGLVVTWLIGAWIVAILIPRSPASLKFGPSNEGLWLHSAIIATGWATLIATSTASLYLTQGLLAGRLLLAALAVVGCILVSRNRPIFSSKALGTFAFVGLVSLLMGLWQHAATELPADGSSNYLVFSDRHKDLPVHVTMAGLIEGSGLPLIKTVPSSTYEFSGPTHIGHAVLIASYSSSLGISLAANHGLQFKEVRTLWVGWLVRHWRYQPDRFGCWATAIDHVYPRYPVNWANRVDKHRVRKPGNTGHVVGNVNVREASLL